MVFKDNNYITKFIAADFVDNTPVDFEFSSTQLVDCVNIPIVDDTIVEGDEIFLVFLSTLDVQVQIGPISSANVLIEDNDCKF